MSTRDGSQGLRRSTRKRKAVEFYVPEENLADDFSEEAYEDAFDESDDSEEIGSNDSDDEDYDPNAPEDDDYDYTDGFVVRDDEVEESDYHNSDEDEFSEEEEEDKGEEEEDEDEEEEEDEEEIELADDDEDEEADEDNAGVGFDAMTEAFIANVAPLIPVLERDDEEEEAENEEDDEDEPVVDPAMLAVRYKTALMVLYRENDRLARRWTSELTPLERLNVMLIVMDQSSLDSQPREQRAKYRPYVKLLTEFLE